MTFDEELAEAAKRNLIKTLGDGVLVAPDYANRIKIPSSLIESVYGLINHEEVLAALRPKMTEMVADRIASALANELTTDVKKILSHEPTRLRLRAAVLREIDTAAHG